MKKRTRLIVAIVVIAIIAFLLLWRFWPRSFSAVMPVDENLLTGFSAGAMVNSLKDGQPDIGFYRLDISEQQDGNLEQITEIIEILSASDYRPDYRNLLPWNLKRFDGGRNYDGRTVLLSFALGDKGIGIQFMSKSEVVVYGSGDSGHRIYHPTNRETIYKLVEYLQTHGTKE